MSMALGIPVSVEQMRELTRVASESAASFLVGFVRFVTRGKEADAESAGSGTLVTIHDGRHAILAASHVIENFPTSGPIGMVLQASERPRREHFSIDVHFLEVVNIAKASGTVEGPDLGLVILAAPIVGELTARGKAFYSLERRRDRMLNNPEGADRGFWGLSGVISEWTLDMPPERPYKRIKAFYHYFRQGDVSGFVNRGRFDYVTFHAGMGGESPAPTNYEGVSGGGLWQVLVKEKDGGAEVKEILLSGVAYFQDSVARGIDLTCHGRRSVYEHAIKAVPVGTTEVST